MEEELEARVLAAQAGVKLHMMDWGAEQREDPLLRAVSQWLRHGKVQGFGTYLPKDLATSTTTQAYMRVRENFRLRGDIIYLQKTLVGEIDSFLVFVVPEGHCQTTLNGCHWDGCHQHKERTLALAAERFWWSGMVSELHYMVDTCRRCKMFKGRSKTALLHPILVSAPLELVHVDFTSIETEWALGKLPQVNDVLVITDHFTRYAQAFITPNQKAKRYCTITSFPSLVLLKRF